LVSFVDKDQCPNENAEFMKRQERLCCNTEGNDELIAPAAPATSLNDNLEFLGRRLHVQTENVGSPVVRIVTHVFCGGRVFMSQKSDLPPGTRASADPGKIRELMHTQHLKVIQEIKDKQARILNAR
jgi:hypothetical protein